MQKWCVKTWFINKKLLSEEILKHNLGDPLKFIFLSIGFIFLCASCVEMLPEQFAPNDAKKDQVFSIDQIIKTKCYIKTQEPIELGSVVSQAQKIILENNQPASVVFNSKSKDVLPVINNLPVVEYEVKGGSICRALLEQKEIQLEARPHSSYDVYFQVTGSHLRVLMSGALHELPYQKLSQALSTKGGQYVIPIGGYPLQQGKVQNVLNAVNQKTHILDFFPNEESLQDIQSSAGIPHKIRKSAKEIYIPELSSSFSSFKYQEKPDLLPKSYFEGVWYSGVSIASTKILTHNRLFGSGTVLSGNNYSHYTPGQKISFQFEAGQLKAINEYYKKQGEKLNYPASAEVLSIPIEHLDYGNTLEDFSAGRELEEPLNRHLSWKKRRYVSVNFSKVQDFHRKRFRAVTRKYLEDSLEEQEKLSTNASPLVTVKEVRFAPDYFDFVIDEGGVEYRFSFFKKYPSKSSAYQPKTIAKTDPAFEFFRLQDNTIFPDPLNSFSEDYENRIRLLRVHPNEKGVVHIYFSKATPQDDLIRSIGREAVSLWNQALSKAGLSWRLFLDETKDVNIGDNRYHVLNMPNEKNRSYAGLAQFYADDETGEVIATSSNVIIPDIQDILEKTIISYAYKKHKLLHSLRRTNMSYPASIIRGRGASAFLQKRTDLSYSIENLHYLLFTNDIHQLLNRRPPQRPQSLDEVHSYFTQLSQDRFIQSKMQVFPDHFENLSPELRSWLKNFKMAYALKEGRFIENESLEQIQNNINKWDMKNFVYEGYSSKLDHTLDIICHDIDNPVLNKASFEASVSRCVQQIYPIYALGVAVHELGHSIFSLRHNFAASTDYSIRDDHNYQLKHLAPYLEYTNAEGRQARVEDRFPSESSSVMDYIKFSDGEQWSPGAYDVSAIQFLFDDFRDEQENFDSVERTSYLQGQWINLNSNGKRRFKRCSDWDIGRSVYCLKFDFGSEPHEIALNEVKSLFHIMDQYFYNQDYLMSNAEFYSSLFRKLWNLMVVYQDWRRHLDNYSRRYFNVAVERLSEKQRTELFSKFTSLFSKNAEEKELLSFYKARNLIYHTLTYLAFLPNRYCVLEKNWQAYDKKRWKPKDSYVLLELSKVIASSSLSDEQQTEPLMSCWQSTQQEAPHPAVAEYLSAYYPDYSLKKEIGHFLYPQDLPLSTPYKEITSRPHKGTNVIRAYAFAALTLTGRFFPVPLGSNPFLSMMNEKDIQKGVERLLLARTTRGAFYPASEFFESFSNGDLERLNPEKSAEKLFGFPILRNGKPDRLFRDEFIQPSQLTSNYENHPQSRTDHYRKNFYQNFLEEQPLLSLFNYLYLQAYILSGGVSRDSISQKRAEIFGDIRLDTSRTSNLLVEKAIQYNKYREFPYLSALYYFELNDFLILPELDVSLDSIGNRILSELAKNSVRLLWTKPYKKSYEGKNLYTSRGGPLQGGFGYYLYEYLGNLLSQFQGTRLGRFYFMYAYLLSLGLLDGYEKAITLPKTSTRDLHRKAIAGNDLLQRSVFNLFGFSFCDGPAVFDNFYKNLESNTRMILEASVKDGQEYQRWMPAGTFQNVEERVQYRQEFEKWLFEICSSDPVNTGKMHQLFLKEGNLLNRLRSAGLNNFVLGSPVIALPSFFRFLWQDRVNLAEERFRNQRLSREVNNIENYLAVKGGIAGIHTVINMLFQFTFPPFFENKRLIQQWIQSNRQILIDVIPKLMLMYSTDRRFVGEFMFLISMIHKYCLNEQEKDPQHCHLVIEKVIGHYFRGSDYVSDPQLELLFNGLFSGRISTVDGTIPLWVLAAKSPKDYTDRAVSALAFDIEVLSDYLFYERGWDTMSANAEELEAQKELLFNILPLSNLRILSSYNFAFSNRMDLSMSRGISEQEQAAEVE